MQKVCDRQALSVQVTLPNGLRIFLLEDHEVPIVHGNLLMRGGQRASPSNKVSPTAPPHALVEREKFTSPFSQPGLCRQDCVHAWAFCSMLRCQSSLPSCVLCHVSVPVGESINKALVHKRDQPVSMWTPAGNVKPMERCTTLQSRPVSLHGVVQQPGILTLPLNLRSWMLVPGSTQHLSASLTAMLYNRCIC